MLDDNVYMTLSPEDKKWADEFMETIPGFPMKDGELDISEDPFEALAQLGPLL